MHDIPFHLISGLVKVGETRDILRLVGAKVEEIPSASDCFDPTDPHDPQFLIEAIVRNKPGQAFFTSQFTNEKNVEVHRRTTADEISRDLPLLRYLIGGLGTSGSTRGVTERLRERRSDLKTIAVHARRHDHIPGIRTADEMWETGIYRRSLYDESLFVTSVEAVGGCLDLIRRCGVLGGPTTGANYKGALSYLKGIDNPEGAGDALFFACDRIEPYLSYVRDRAPVVFFEHGPRVGVAALTDEEVKQAPVISCSEAWTKLTRKKILCIDLRGQLAFRLGSIPGARNIPSNLCEQLLVSASAFDPDTAILFVCPVGEESRSLSALAIRSGMRLAMSLDGGMVAWREAGLPIIRQEENATEFNQVANI
jgi:cysteine synthase B